MKAMSDRVKQLFEQNIESQIALADVLTEKISNAAQRLVNCLLNEGKIFLCGNGGSAANCLHFISLMLNHFEAERPPLPAMMLGSDVTTMTGFTHEGHSDQIYARQLQAFGRENDLLLVLSTAGNASNILNAVTAAHDCGLDVIFLSGRDGGILSNHLGPEDLELRVPSDVSVRIREVHLFMLHCFGDLIERSLFGSLLG
jgi:D-sedoheptulose 7-phosphate isomerase